MKESWTQRVALGLCLGSAVAPALAGEIVVDAGRGPVAVHLPPSWDPAVPTPLLLILHGYGAPPNWLDFFPRLVPLTEEHGFAFAAPIGLKDDLGLPAWNGAGCCGVGNGADDDAGYLTDLIQAVGAAIAVDERRVHVLGLSNGGFMAYALACESSELVAGIATLAAATWKDPLACAPAAPVHVLHIHGTADAFAPFAGTEAWPGALETVGLWLDLDGCAESPVALRSFDSDLLVPGPETQVTSWTAACDPGGSVELWSLVGSGHQIAPTVTWVERVMAWFAAHPKPVSAAPALRAVPVAPAATETVPPPGAP